MDMKVPQTRTQPGDVFGLLTVVERRGTLPSGDTTWLCNCECGKQVVRCKDYLRRRGLNSVPSCGCDGRRALRESAAAARALINYQDNAERVARMNRARKDRQGEPGARASRWLDSWIHEEDDPAEIERRIAEIRDSWDEETRNQRRCRQDC